MNYINKNTGDSITESVYLQLTEVAKNNFIKSEINSHTIVETKSNSLSVGDSIVLVALSPLIIFKSIFG